MIVHVVTRKGMGYAPAEDDEAEQMHSAGVIDPLTGLATQVPAPGWTAAFSDALIRLRRQAPRHRRDHRGDARTDRAVAPSVSGSRTGCSTSVSPNSTR